jgi:ABC-type branched-subunit amino acid transport system ATPase component
LKGGIESLPLVHPESGSQVHSLLRKGRTIIQGGLEEVRNSKELQDAYLGEK